MTELVVMNQAGDRDPWIWGPLSVEMPSVDRKLIRLHAVQRALPHIIKRGRFSVRHHDQLVGEIVPLLQVDAARIPKDAKIRRMVAEVTESNGGLPTGILSVTEAIADVFPRLKPVIGKHVAFAGGRVYDDPDNQTSQLVAKDVRAGRLDSFSISGTSFHTKHVEWCDPTGCRMVEEVEDMDGSAITIGSSRGTSGSPFDAKTMNPGAAFVVVQQAGQEPCDKPELKEARLEVRLAHEADRFPSPCALRTLMQAGELETTLQESGGNRQSLEQPQPVGGNKSMAGDKTVEQATPAAPTPEQPPATGAPKPAAPEGIAEAMVDVRRRLEDLEKNQAQTTAQFTQLMAKIEAAMKAANPTPAAGPGAPTNSSPQGPAPGSAAEQAKPTTLTLDAVKAIIAEAIQPLLQSKPTTPATAPEGAAKPVAQAKPARVVQTPEPATPGQTGNSAEELRVILQASDRGDLAATKELVKQVTRRPA